MQNLENQVGALKNSVMPGGAAYVGVMSSINTDFNVSSEKTFNIPIPSLSGMLSQFCTDNFILCTFLSSII